MKTSCVSSHDSLEKELDVNNGAQSTSKKINGRGFVMRTALAICAIFVLLRTQLPSKFVTTPSRNPTSNSIITGVKEDKAYGWKDDIWPIRPQQPWDISTDFAHPRKLEYDVEQGTWLRLDISPDGEIVFDMLGDLYCLPSDALRRLDGQTRWRAYPILLGVPWDSDPHFSPDGRKLVFRSDAGLGVENIWTMPWRGCRAAALRSYDHGAETAYPLNQGLLQALAHEEEDESWLAQGFKEDDNKRQRRLLREGRSETHRVTNETYRWVSDARFHPDGDKVIATKWYTSGRSLGAGEGWIYEVPLSETPIKPGDGMRVVGRSLPFGWKPEQYPDQQIGPEQFVWWGKDRVIYSKNVAEESDGAFEYSKDVYKGIYAIFARNLTTGATEKLVSASPGSASRPELSHDGRTLAFVRRVRDKEALVLKDLVSGTIRNIWYGLTYDATPISAPMGTYPSFAFTQADDAVVIWAGGSLWRVSLLVNRDGERVGNGEPTKILFKATIEKRLAETRISETDLLKEESRDVQRIRVFKELAVDETGSNAVFRAGGKTVHRSFGIEDPRTHKTGEKLVPVVVPNATYYSPSFVPHMPSLVIHVRWSDIFLSTFELADLSRQMAFEVSGGLPLGRYDSPVICECEGLNRHVAFIRRGGDAMTGHVVATANPGIYIGTLTLPSPFGMPNATERTFAIKDIRRVSRMTPRRIKFVDGACKILAHTSQSASVIDISGEPDATGEYPAETLAEGKMSVELAVTPRVLNGVKSGAHMRTAPAKIGYAAFVDFFQVYVVDGTDVDKQLWSKPGLNATRGLARVSLDGGHDLTWSGDGSTLFWFLGPYLHSLKVDQLKHCRSAIQGDPSTFGIDCVRQYVNVTEVHVYHQSESRRLSDDAYDVARRETKSDVDPSQSHADILVIINATLVTMATGSEAKDIVHDGTIIMQGGVIQLVGKGLVAPQGAKVIDAQGGVIVPGFVDVHAHWNGADTVASSWEQLAFLAYGCTTMHNPSSDTVDTWTERVRVESGLMLGPRIFTTGTIIYGAGEAGYHQDIADDAEARSALIRLKVEAGPYAFSYKNYNIPSRASRQRLIKVAKDLEMNVYPEGGMNFDWDLTYIVDGMTTVEHSLPIPTLYDDVLTLFSASGTGNTPTHIVNYGGIFGEEYVWAHESLPFDDKLRRFVPHGYLEGLSRSVTAPRDSYQLFNTSASVYEMTKRGLNGNVGAHGEPPVGLNYHEEMWFFTKGGMTPYEVLRSATRSGALSLGLFSSIGSLQEGKLADMLIYPPGAAILDDISLSRDIRFVIKGGRVWDASTMEEEWPLKGKRPSLPPLSAD